MPDPLTLLGEEAWLRLEANSGFTDLVKPGNRIKYDVPLPVKHEISTADVPEVRIIPTGDSIAAPLSSSSTRLLESFEVQVATGDRQLAGVLWPLKWEVYRALITWMTTLATPQKLRWDTTIGSEKDVSLINLRLQAATDGILNEALSRGIVGWASFIVFQAELIFPTQDIVL